ncbi:proton-coupled folate transporter-like [Pomacea canaliculata]|uniref:proton-coupled folate transporter-like n=1 Tax=Pomacea canaliculata TaxID=400727 RepID=UPI000D735171|nr:proton-coupled folate transporter-like [Pomacea canaliculata]
MMNAMIEALLNTTRSQYRFRFFQSQYEGELLGRSNVTRACGEAMEPEVQEVEFKISDESARWTLYEWYTNIVPLMMSTVLMGMKSDQIGRRFIFLFPFFISMIDCILFATIIRLGLHYKWSLIGQFLWGVSGGGINMLVASYALVSDTHGNETDDSNSSSPSPPNDDTDLDPSREKGRTMKFVIVDVLRWAGSSVTAFGSGYVISSAGFFYAVVIIMVWKTLNFTFAYVLVTETGKQKKSPGLVAPLKTIYAAFKNPRKGLTLFLVTTALLFSVYAVVGEDEVLRTYQMSPPFCMSSVELGWFASETRLKSFFGLPLMWLWRRMHLAESTIAALGMASAAASQFFMALVRYTWVFYAVPVIAIPMSLAGSMTKVITSRLIGRRALASTFALLLLTEELFAFAGSMSTNYLYQAFLKTTPAAPIFLCGAGYSLSCVLYSIETFNSRRKNPAGDDDVEVNVQEMAGTRK